MKLIVGLGNPGKIYQYTRHNIGFMFVDQLIQDLNQKFILDKSFKSQIAMFNYNGEKIIIIKPQTFMNLSGEAVLSVSKYFKVDVEDIIVVFDDLDLPEGKIRCRKSGSSGGHKGMKNIIDLFGTDEIKRIRIGIGKNNKSETSDYVLSKLSKDEIILFALTMTKAREMFDYLLAHTFDDFMSQFN